jgi:multicomponent Na+:H+ antiporter subunit A
LAPVRWPYRGLLSAGVIVAVLSGVWGFQVGSFLKPVRFDIPLPWGGEYGFTSAMVFDLGVYLAVLAIIIALINELGGVLPGDVKPTSQAGPVLVSSRYAQLDGESLSSGRVFGRTSRTRGVKPVRNVRSGAEQPKKGDLS